MQRFKRLAEKIRDKIKPVIDKIRDFDDRNRKIPQRILRWIGTLAFAVITVLAADAIKILSRNIPLRATVETTVELKLVSSAVAVFSPTTRSQQEMELIQLIAFKITASARIEDVKVEATFEKPTKVEEYYIMYSSDIDGFKPELSEAKNHITLSLNRPLNEKTSAKIYLLTKKPFKRDEKVRLKFQNISVVATDRDNKKVRDSLPAR